MERILLIVNAHRPDASSIEFATRMAALSRTKLTTLFLENVSYEPALVAQPDVLQFSSFFLHAGGVVAKQADVDMAVGLVKEECRFAGVSLDVIVGKGDTLQQAVCESRFSDFIIMDPGMSFAQHKESLPSHFVREVLVHAECPVLLSPKEFVGIDEVVFCYDGSASSVFAIKQFTLLLPQFRTQQALLLEVNPANTGGLDDGHKRMMDWLKMHYSSVYYQALTGNAKDELFKYLFLKTQKLVILGAYGRSMLSNFFRRSHADALIRMVDLPLFITHL